MFAVVSIGFVVTWVPIPYSPALSHTLLVIFKGTVRPDLNESGTIGQALKRTSTAIGF
jgi:hypothetical protein